MDVLSHARVLLDCSIRKRCSAYCTTFPKLNVQVGTSLQSSCKNLGNGLAAFIQQDNHISSGRSKDGLGRNLYAITGSPFSSPEEDASSVSSEELGSKIDLNLPRRRLQVSFTCDACGVRSQRLINPRAYSRGTVFVQCAGCEVYHKLVDNLGLIEEIDYRLEMNNKADELGLDALE